MRTTLLALACSGYLVPVASGLQAGPNAVWQEAVLQSADLAQADGFGAAMCADGNRLVIGAPQEDGASGSPTQYGAVYVFESLAGTWVEQHKIVPSDPIPNQEFGGALALDGDTLAVGGQNGACEERVYVYRFNGTTWLEEARLEDPGAGICHRFGASIAVLGDVLLVGATRTSVGVPQTGAAYIYRHFAGSWVLEQTLSAPVPQGDARFGKSVALGGGYAYVGEPNRRGGVGFPGGRCFVFDDTGSGWVIEQVLQPVNSASDDGFGESLDLDGDRLVVGAPRAFTPGSAYVYLRTAGALVLEQEVQLAEPEAARSLGSDVAIDGDTLLIGGNSASVQSSSSGAAFQFRHVAGIWQQGFALWTTNVASGSSNAEAVEVVEDQLLTSSSTKSLVGSSSGAAFVYDQTTFPEVETSYCPGKVASTGCLTTLRTLGLPGLNPTESFSIRANGFGAATFGLIFYSLAPDSVPFAGGTLCLQMPLARVDPASPAGVPFSTGPCDARILSPLGQLISSGTDASLVAGARMHCQLFYRDSGDPAGIGLSDALSFVIQP